MGVKLLVTRQPDLAAKYTIQSGGSKKVTLMEARQLQLNIVPSCKKRLEQGMILRIESGEVSALNELRICM